MREMRIKQAREMRRARRIRRKILHTSDRLRLCVFRSNKHFYAQIIDDVKNVTLIGVSEKELEKDSNNQKSEKAAALGMLLAKKASEKKISKVTFDKGPYRYHGRVKRFADGAREGGLQF